ncbi:MAG: hypothetical protein ACLFUN_02255 [Desulfobacterales bacterium]
MSINQGGNNIINPTQKLRDKGQSLRLDNITRELLESRRLGRYIGELSVASLFISRSWRNT